MEDYMNKPQVFKVQRPLLDHNAPYLIYNKDRSIYFELASPELDTLVGDDLKIYARGYINEEHKFIIEGKVPKEKW